ncbi:MAG TPA: hypothetical protein VGG03_24700 [Thermoanaerobaculia bacterium]|jgi:hypothetical protein
MPTIDAFHRDTPGKSGLVFRLQVEQGQQALAYFELLQDHREIDHRTVTCGEGERELALEDIFPDLDLSGPALEVTYTIGTGGRIPVQAALATN